MDSHIGTDRSGNAFAAAWQTGPCFFRSTVTTRQTDVGDVGRIYFVIRRQDLEQKDFKNVWLILQCT